MTTTTSALTVECAKPGCHWRGSAADAPTHPCPTPAAAGPPPIDRSAVETNGEHVHDPRPSLSTQRSAIEQRLQAAGVTYSSDATLDDLRGLAALLVDQPSAPEPQKTSGEPQLREPQAAEVDPERNDPGRLTDQAESDAELDSHGADTNARPWQTVIAAALDQQGSVAAYKWLVVWHPEDPTREASLMGRGKTKNEATVIREDIAARGTLGGDTVVVKTADVLKAAQTAQEAHRGEETPPPQTEAATVEEAPMAPLDALDQASDALTKVVAHTIDEGLREQGKETLFDVEDYRDPTLALPQIDGHDIDRIAISFQGEIMLDRSDKDHVALWRRLKLGQRVELWVEAKGLGYAGKGATNKDGELDVIVAKRTVTVQHVRVLGPEDLGEAALELSSQARDAAEAQDARDRAKEANDA